jgi:ribosomal protein S18 acetylase RimI-like enzyme
MRLPATTFRPAAPSFDEGQLFAHYLDQAAEGFFRFMLGPRAVDIIAAVFIQPGHDLSYQHAAFAEREKVIVGMVSGYTAEQHRQSSSRILEKAAGRYNVRFMIISALFSPFLRIIDTIADGDFYLQSIAVDKEYRGKGIGSALMKFIEDAARAAGSKRLALDVSAKNDHARDIYTHFGMIVESQWPKRLTIPGLRLLRMTKPL